MYFQQDERDQISRIDDGLFLTNHRGVERKEEMNEKGITHVINVNGGIQPNACDHNNTAPSIQG